MPALPDDKEHFSDGWNKSVRENILTSHSRRAACTESNGEYIRSTLDAAWLKGCGKFRHVTTRAVAVRILRGNTAVETERVRCNILRRHHSGYRKCRLAGSGTGFRRALSSTQRGRMALSGCVTAKRRCCRFMAVSAGRDARRLRNENAADWAVVNRTGPDTDLRRSVNPVLRNLVEQGWLQPNPHRPSARVDGSGPGGTPDAGIPAVCGWRLELVRAGNSRVRL